MTQEITAIVLALTVTMVGMPHGGLDHLFGRAVLEPRLGPFWQIAFGSLYLGFAGLVVLGWWCLPLLTLLGFFTISAYHFGEADGQQGFRAIWDGSPIIWLPLLARPDEVSELLAWIIPGGTISVTLAWLNTAKPFLICVAFGLTVDLAFQAARQNWFTLTRGLLLVAIVVALPVLVSFGLFFCGWHSTRELWQLAKRMQPRKPSSGLVQVLKLAAPRALGASAMAGAGTWYFAAPTDLTPALVQAIFLGLSAVAVPHILLHAYAEQLQADPFERMVTA